MGICLGNFHCVRTVCRQKANSSELQVPVFQQVLPPVSVLREEDRIRPLKFGNVFVEFVLFVHKRQRLSECLLGPARSLSAVVPLFRDLTQECSDVGSCILGVPKKVSPLAFHVTFQNLAVHCVADVGLHCKIGRPLIGGGNVWSLSLIHI